MHAIRYARYGGPEVLELVEVDEPHAGPGEVRIAVRAAGVNGIDWKFRQGLMAEMVPLELPAGTGVEASGLVDEIGEGVTGVELGDGVLGSGSSTLAEYAVLTAWVRKPADLSFAEAAGWTAAVETATRILDEVGVQPGQTLVVSGASGGVGSATVQLAVSRGIIVIGTASAANRDYLASLGAIPTTYGDGWVDRVRALAPDGVDAALDIAGAGVIPGLIELTGNPSSVLTIADFSAGALGAKISSTAGDYVAALEGAVALAERGAFTLRVDQTFPLAEAAQAQQASQAGHAAGRIVVDVAD